MSDERKRDDDWASFLAAWPAPAPRPGFADRVLAACDRPPPAQLAIVREPAPRRLRAGGILVCAVVAAALGLVPFAFHRRQLPAGAATVVTLGSASDLGLGHD